MAFPSPIADAAAVQQYILAQQRGSYPGQRDRHQRWRAREAREDPTPRPKIEWRRAAAKNVVWSGTRGRVGRCSKCRPESLSRSMQQWFPGGRSGTGRFRGADLLEKTARREGAAPWPSMTTGSGSALRRNAAPSPLRRLKWSLTGIECVAVSARVQPDAIRRGMRLGVSDVAGDETRRPRAGHRRQSIAVCIVLDRRCDEISTHAPMPMTKAMDYVKRPAPI